MNTVSSPAERYTISGESFSEEDPFHNSDESNELYKPSDILGEDSGEDNEESGEEEGSMTVENSYELVDTPAIFKFFSTRNIQQFIST